MNMVHRKFEGCLYTDNDGCQEEDEDSGSKNTALKLKTIVIEF
jgi:hypothetical protein